jgi:hypothetical protein
MKFDDFLEEEGYIGPRQLPTGDWLAVRPMVATVGLFVIENGDDIGYRYRYCYPNLVSAVIDLHLWNGQGDPTGPWVKQKGSGYDRLNPALADPDRDFGDDQ